MAVLPHQAAGAMSAIEDAEALSVYLRHATSDASSVHAALMQMFRVRFKRASQCQELSRVNNILNVEPNANKGDMTLRLWTYPGAEQWAAEHREMVLDVV
jgi:2-polyprenyl-6-methoxyphenol hydroxylase-like FAD-dependent oxidoreductase